MITCVHHQFEDQVARSPQAVAVAIGDSSLSYEALNSRANQLALRLRRMGVGRNDLVAVCCEPGPEMVIALLGVLKSGAAYVPLDPDYPDGRIESILTLTGNPILLTQANLGCGNVVSSRVMRLDSEWETVGKFPEANLPRNNSADDLVYCVFTSGSTGEPKGALNLHRGFANLCSWYSGSEACGGRDARTLVVSSIGFDLTQKNIFEPLVSGGLLIFGSHKIGEVAEVKAAVIRYRPTRINCAPSAFAALKNVLLCDSLRMVVFGGEPVGARVAEEIADRGIQVMNSYGPTECSDVAMYHVGPGGAGAPMPLGKPIPNVEIYLVDKQLRPISGAGEGELLIGGIGVGRGYVGRPDLSADRFIARLFGDPATTLYRSGDLVRRVDDNTLHYVGRLDDQVKIRGHRVELGEVEAALANVVKSVAVVAQEHRAGGKQLVAFIVACDGAALSVDDLRTYLSQRLPAPMIPTVWKLVPDLPLNANGKIDRLALRRMSAVNPVPPAPRVEAATTMEAVLVEIWREALASRNVGVEDDFFVLGGDSLSAMTILIGVQDRLSRALSLEELYSSRTIRALAVRLDAPQS